MADPFIVCDNLVKIYKVAGLEVVALQGLDLQVAQGEILGIVGTSGSGKTTLMNILGGLDRPSAGRVWVGGQNLLELSDAALNRYRRTRVGFVWQQPARNLIPYLSALDNVRWPMALSGRAGRQANRRAAELLAAVGLSERAHHRLAELSGGEQQRVALAVALANLSGQDGDLLLADEPTGELDSATAREIYQLFRHLSQTYGLTTIIVSHDIGLAHYVDRVVSIRDGKTSTETVRQTAGLPNDKHETTPEQFEEYVVLDKAGRLQIPPSLREQFNIGGRVRLHPQADGILIQPVAGIAPTGEIAEKLKGEKRDSEKGWRRWFHLVGR